MYVHSCMYTKWLSGTNKLQSLGLLKQKNLLTLSYHAIFGWWVLNSKGENAGFKQGRPKIYLCIKQTLRWNFLSL